MIYSEDFKKRVKTVYPDHKPLHKALDNGTAQVGFFLGNPQDHRVFNDQILSALDKGRLDDLRTLAEDAQARTDLSREWQKLNGGRPYNR